MKTHVRPTSGIIAVDIETPKGVRSISTGTTDPKEAKAILKAANVESVEVLAKAGQLTQALIQKLTLGGSMTVEKSMEEWEEWIRDTANSDRTAECSIAYARMWSRDSHCLRKKLCEVRQAHVDKWVNQEEGGPKLASRRVRLAAVRSFFQFCSIKEYLNPDPARFVRVKAKLLTHEQKEPRKKVPFTDEEMRKILDSLTLKIVELVGNQNTPAAIHKLETARFWYIATVIGRYTGLRQGDICCLEWASLKEPGKLIVWTDKRDTRVELPLNEELQKAIAMIPPNSQKFCFPQQCAVAKDAKSRSKLSTQYGRVLEAAEVHGHMFHDLRHTLATELHVNGNSLEEIAKALGHGSKDSTKAYVH